MLFKQKDKGRKEEKDEEKRTKNGKIYLVLCPHDHVHCSTYLAMCKYVHMWGERRGRKGQTPYPLEIFDLLSDPVCI